MAKAQAQIRSLARSHTESALKVLAGIMNKTDAPAAARVTAAQALLDRGWGKPEQTVIAELDVHHHVARLPSPSPQIDQWRDQQQIALPRPLTQ